MRFGEIFRYEFSYRLRSVPTWLYGGFLLLISFWIVHVGATSGATVKANAPQRVAEMSALFCGLFGMLVSAGLFSDAAIRDRAVRMDALLFTTRLRPIEYLGGRFLAALAINAILVFAIPTGLAIATRMPYLDRDQFGPERLAAYLQPMFLFVLPNLVLAGAILFTIAALTRQAIPVYLGAIGIFIGYIFAANYWTGITNPMLSALADPLGINALKGMTKYWTAAERNSELIGFPPMLLLNRALWLLIAASILAVLQRTFRFTQREDREQRVAPVEAEGAAIPTDVRVPSPAAAPSALRQTFAITRESLVEVMSGRAFYVALVAAIGLVLLWGWNVGESVFETITWPVTHLVAGVVLSQRAMVVPWLVIALYAGELVWKDRETGSAEIADAMPVRTGVALLGRFLALVSIVVLFQIAFLIGGILLQVLHGYYNFEPGIYIRILFGFKLVELVLLAAFAMTVHVVVNHKYIGHVVVLLATIFNTAALYGIHHLFIFNSGPQLNYSDMNGFGSIIEAFVWFKLYWTAWVVLFAVVATLFWVRGPQLGVRARLATARARFRGPSARVAALAIVLILLFGGFIFYNTNVLNEYLSPKESERPQAEYERLYGRYRDLPQPVISGANLRFEIYPETYALDMRGSYELVNRTGAAIPAIHIETPNGRNYLVRSMTFDRASKPQLVDQPHGYRIFTLERPLAPGDSMRFSFDIAMRSPGFRHGGWYTQVVHNGSYFDRRLLPFIGYQPGFEASGEAIRKRFGLPPQAMPAANDASARRFYSRFRDSDRLNVETIVGTAADQIAIVPGVLRRTWTENGRRYFHYGTRLPETFGTAVFSARYAVREDRWNGVQLQIFHHPPHRYDLDRMMAAMKASLDYYTATFGPFPYRELRVVEIPPYSINGRAFPSAIAFAEQNFITRSEKGLVDLTFFGTAHEIAHHWWGAQVRPAYAKGRSFVNETLANYSAMLVTEKVLGPAEARRVYDFQMNRYLTQRSELGRDVPLLEVEDHPYISYGKGAVAMYTLREAIGDEAVNTALRRFLTKYGRSGPPYATSLDLYAELRAVTPPAFHTLLTDLFETITLWDVKTHQASVRRLPDGKYEVTLKLVAHKMRADSIGRETQTPMNDLVEVGIYGKDKDEPIYLARHRIQSGEQTLRIIVPQEPSRAGLDPYGKLIETEREDNVVKVEVGK